MGSEHIRKLTLGFAVLVVLVVLVVLGVTFQSRDAQAAITSPSATNTDTTITYSFSWTGSNVARRDAFIDADQDKSGTTGYAIGGIYAEYLLQNGVLHKFTGGTQHTLWSWDAGISVTYAPGSPVQWTFNRVDVGETNPCSEASTIVFRTEDTAGNTVDILSPYSQTFTPSSTCSPLRLGMASYFDLGTSYWTDVEQSNAEVSFVVMNPSTGPGASFNQSWADEMSRVHNAGIAIYGYIKSRQTGAGTLARQPADYVADIDRWYIWYGSYLTGLFIDEEYPNCTSNKGPNGESGFNEAQYYKNIIAYMKASRDAYQPAGGIKIILNPGSLTDECMFKVNVNNTTNDLTQDIIQANFESTLANYRTWSIPAGRWELNYPASKFWNLVHTASSTADLQEAISLARTAGKHAGTVYVTDEFSDANWVGCYNPHAGTWNLLPGTCHSDASYWTTEKQLTD